MAESPRRLSARIAVLVAAMVLIAAVVLLLVTADPSPSMARKLFGRWRAAPVLGACALLLVAGAMIAVARSRETMLSYLTSVATVGFLWLLLEISGLLGWVQWHSLLGPPAVASPIGWSRMPNVDLSGLTEEDMTSSWGVAATRVPYRYKTDRHGYRNEVDRESARLYVLGDSIVVGALTPHDQTVTAVLERSVGVPAMQVALLGKGPQEVQQLFRDARLPVKDALVIQFVFEGNDLLDSRRFRSRGGETGSTRVALKDRSLSLAVLLALQRWTQPVHGAEHLRTCQIAGQRYAFGWVRDSFAGHEDEAPYIEQSLETFAREITLAGGSFAVVFVPTKLRVLGSLCRFPPGSELTEIQRHLGPLHARLRAWSERTSIPLLDLTPALQASAQAGQIPWLAGDTHWNAVGHAVSARTIADWGVVRQRFGSASR